MDFINRALAQLSDLFRSMTPAARITTALLLVVIVVSVAYLFNHQLSGSDTYLFGGDPVRSSELPGMLAAFGKKNLTDYEMDGNRIRVSHGKQAVYMSALADEGALPHNFLDPLKNSLSGSYFIDRKTRDEKIHVALQEQLAEIVSHMNGVEWATVLYNVDNQTSFGAKKEVTASVTVKPVGGQFLSDDQVQKIRIVVGPPIGAVPDSVSVVDVNGHAYPGSTNGETASASMDRYLNTKVKYEEGFARSIREALSFVTGAVVTVNVTLNPELEDIESTNRFDPKAVASEITESNKTQDANSTPPSGRPGPASQLANAPASVGSGAGGTSSKEEQSSSRTRNMVGNESRQIKKAGLTPKRVTASVAVPSSYYEEIWRQQNPTSAGSAPKKPEKAALAQIETDANALIKKHVVGALPPPEETGAEQVVVTSFTSMPTPDVPKPAAADRAMSWFTDHASSIGMGFLGIVSLLMVRSIVRSVPAPIAATESESPPADESVEEAEEEETEASPAPRLRRRRSKSGPSLRDELVEIVREDPDAAANILRTWIGTAN